MIVKEITLKFLRNNDACSSGQSYFKTKLDLNKVKSLSTTETISWLKQIERLDWAEWLIGVLMDHEQRVKYITYALKQAIKACEEEHPWESSPLEIIKALKQFAEEPTRENYLTITENPWKFYGGTLTDNTIYAAGAVMECIAYKNNKKQPLYVYNAIDLVIAAIVTSSVEDIDFRKIKLMIVNYGLRLLGIKAPKRIRKRRRTMINICLYCGHKLNTDLVCTNPACPVKLKKSHP